jgi:hypothetical protein
MTIELHYLPGGSCIPCFTNATSPEKPLLMGKGAVVSFYNNWLVTQMMAQCVPCACCCPEYQNEVANKIAHKLLPVEDFLKLLYLPQSADAVEAYNAFKLDHDTIIDSYQTSGIRNAYKCTICLPCLLPVGCILPWCFSKTNNRTFKAMSAKMRSTVETHRESLLKAGFEITTAHIAAPYPDGPARFPCCCRSQEMLYKPYAGPAVVIYKAGTKPPTDLDKALTEKNPNYTNTMWR